MNTQLARTHHDHHEHHHHHELDPLDAGGVHNTTGTEGVAGGEEHHHGGGGVKSVLKKVKQKAKKVKDTLKAHGHHDHDHDVHHHDHHNVPGDHDLDVEEDDDVDEEMIQDPAVHGAASVPEAAVAAGLRSGVAGKSAMQPDYYDGGYSAADPMKLSPLEAGENRGGLQGRKLSDIREEPRAPFNSPATMTTTTITEHPRHSEPGRAFVAQQERDRGHPQITMDEVTGNLEEDPHSPLVGPTGGASRWPSNHQTKTLDRTDAGGEEAGIPLTVLESLEKAHISEGGKVSQGNDGGGGLRRRSTRDVASVLPTGTHNQFSPEVARPQPMSSFESAKHQGKKVETHIPAGDQYTGETAQNQSSYTEKISSATAVIADKAISAKNAVASKLGYGDTAGEHHVQDAGASNSASPVEYGKKIAATVTEKLTPVYETVTSTVASAGNTVMSKVHGGGGGSTTTEVVTESEERKPMGVVTESEEVKQRLGNRKTEDMKVEGSSVSIPPVGGFVGGKLKGAVESWFGTGQQPQPPRSSGDHQSIGSTTGAQGFSGSGDERQQGAAGRVVSGIGKLTELNGGFLAALLFAVLGFGFLFLVRRWCE